MNRLGLFIICCTRTGRPFGDQTFSNKRIAKKARDMMTVEKKEPYHVSLGPDHWRYK